MHVNRCPELNHVCNFWWRSVKGLGVERGQIFSLWLASSPLQHSRTTVRVCGTGKQFVKSCCQNDEYQAWAQSLVHTFRKNFQHCFNKKLSWCWQTARRVQRSVKVTEHGASRHVRYGFLLMVTLSLRRSVFSAIRLQKCRDIEKLDREPMTSYSCSILTMVLPSVASEILNVEKYLDLQIPVQGQSRSLKVVPFDRLDMVSY